MASSLEELSAALKSMAGDWARYAAFGVFLLYLSGYLALRFHLAVLGVAADLSVIDERYLLAGARFLVFLVVSLINVLLLSAPWALAAWLAWRVVPAGARAAVAGRPGWIAAAGIAVALAAIQFLLRPCLVLHDLLLADRLPREAPAWLVGVLLGDAGYHFDLQVALCLLPLLMLNAVPAGTAPVGRGLLAALVSVQCLFLPVNFGVLIMDQRLPRVDSAGDRPLVAGDRAWLAWEGAQMLTFFIHRADGRRSLVTLARDKAGAIEVVGYDPIFAELFLPNGERRAPPRRGAP